MKLGYRIPSLNKKIAARTSVKRLAQNLFKIKAPRGYGWITNPEKFAYNKVYNKTSKGCVSIFILLLTTAFALLYFIKFHITI